MHTDGNNYECFNNLIYMILKICQIALFARATPGRSLVAIHVYVRRLGFSNFVTFHIWRMFATKLEHHLTRSFVIMSRLDQP